MATKKLDTLCTEFIKRIPDQLRESFTPGIGALPNGYLLPATTILDYVNRALYQLFNNFWKSSGGDLQTFMRIFPELIQFTSAVTLGSGNYDIASPYKNFYKIVGAVTEAGKYIKVKNEDLFTVYLAQEYGNIAPTQDDPAVIQVNQRLAFFPQNLTGTIRFHYIARPVSPLTGNALEQNGSYDSPFFESWHNDIVDIAYMKYLQETNETT